MASPLGVFKRLQNAFKGNNSSTSSDSTRQFVSYSVEEQAEAIGHALIRLRKSEPLQSRIQVLVELCEYVKIYRLNDAASVWFQVQDLLQPGAPMEAQEAAFNFMCCLIQGQQPDIEKLKRTFFRIISTSNVSSGSLLLPLRLLTKDGKDISELEREVGKLILTLLTQLEGQNLVDLQELVTNVAKYNFLLLDEETRDAIVKRMCQISNSATNVLVVEKCLGCFDVVVKYSHLSSSSLRFMIAALCRAVNIETFCKWSWTIMENVLKGSSGYQGLQALCSTLNDSANYQTVNLLRGAVFFIGMSLWGSHRIQKLKVSPAAVLPSLLNVLASEQSIVAYEVLLAISRLVKKYGHDLRLEWDCLIQIYQRLLPYLEQQQNTSFADIFTETITWTAEIVHKGIFFGNKKALFQMLEKTTKYQEIQSVSILMHEKAQLCLSMDADWLDNLSQFMDLFFRNETREKIKRDAVSHLKHIHNVLREFVGEDFVEYVILTTFTADSFVGLSDQSGLFEDVIDLLVDVANTCGTSHFSRIIDLFEDLMYSNEHAKKYSAHGLVRVFKMKYQKQPVSSTLFVYTKLIKHIYGDNAEVRLIILESLLQIEADSRGYVILSGVKSPFLKILKWNPAGMLRTSVGATPTSRRESNLSNTLQFSQLFNALTFCMQHETNEKSFALVLHSLSRLMLDCVLMTSVDVGKLASVLHKLVTNNLFGINLATYNQRDEKVNVYYEAAYKILNLTVGYNNILKPEQRTDILDALIFGLTNRSWPTGLTRETIQSIHRTCLSTLTLAFFDFPIERISEKLLHIVDALILNWAKESHLSALLIEFVNVIVSKRNLLALLSHAHLQKLFRVLLHFCEQSKSVVLVATAFQAITLLFVSINLKQRPQAYQFVCSHLFPLILPPEQQPTTGGTAFHSAGHARENNSLVVQCYLEALAKYCYTDEMNENLTLYDKQLDEMFLTKNVVLKQWVQGNSIVSVATGSKGWSKIVVRRPTGVVCWVSKFNQPGQTNILIPPLQEASFLQQPNLEEMPILQQPQTPKPTQSIPTTPIPTPIPTPQTQQTSLTTSQNTQTTPQLSQPQISQQTPLLTTSQNNQTRPQSPIVITKRTPSKSEIQIPLISDEFQQGLTNAHTQNIQPQIKVTTKQTIEVEKTSVQPQPTSNIELKQSNDSEIAVEETNTETQTSEQRGREREKKEKTKPLSPISNSMFHSPSLRKLKRIPSDFGRLTTEDSVQETNTTNSTNQTNTRRAVSPSLDEFFPLTESTHALMKRNNSFDTSPPLNRSSRQNSNPDMQRLSTSIDSKTTSSLSMFYPPLLSYEGDTHSPALLSPPRSIAQPGAWRDKSELSLSTQTLRNTNNHSGFNNSNNSNNTSNSNNSGNNTNVHTSNNMNATNTNTQTTNTNMNIPPPVSELTKKGTSLLNIEGQMMLHSVSSESSSSSVRTRSDSFSSPKSTEPVLFHNSNSNISHHANVLHHNNSSTNVSNNNTNNNNTLTNSGGAVVVLNRTNSNSNSNTNLTKSIHNAFQNQHQRKSSHDKNEIQKNDPNSTTQTSKLSKITPDLEGRVRSVSINNTLSDTKQHEQTQPHPRITPISNSKRFGDSSSSVHRVHSDLSNLPKISLENPSNNNSNNITSEISHNQTMPQTSKIDIRKSNDFMQPNNNNINGNNVNTNVNNSVSNNSNNNKPTENILLDLRRSTEFLPRNQQNNNSNNNNNVTNANSNNTNMNTNTTPMPTTPTLDSQQKPQQQMFQASPIQYDVKVQRSASLSVLTSQQQQQQTPQPLQQSQSQQQIGVGAVSQTLQNLPILNPNFVMLQMQFPLISPFGPTNPKTLKSGEALDRAIGVLDRIMGKETHKIGVVFVGTGQTTQEQIFANQQASPRYLKFIRELGKVVRVKDCIENGIYSGGLDGTSDTDGEFSILWEDHVKAVMFHISTMMPTLANDNKAFTNKKSHIGNDNVVIVFCEDYRVSYSMDTLTSQFNFVHILINPLEYNFYRVEILKKPDVVAAFGPLTSTHIVSEQNLAPLIRMTAITADIATGQRVQSPGGTQFSSNLEERIRQIRQIEKRFAPNTQENEGDQFIRLFPSNEQQQSNNNNNNTPNQSEKRQ